MDGALVAGDDQGVVYVWNTSSWNLIKSRLDSPETLNLVSSISPLDSGRIVVSQRSLNIYGTESAKVERTLYGQTLATSASEAAEMEKQYSAVSVVLGDGRIADGTEGGVVRIWDIADGRTAELTQGIDRGYLGSLAVDRAGTKLAAGFSDFAHADDVGSPVPTSVVVWDLRAMKVEGEYKASSGDVLYDSDGRLMYFGPNGFTVDPAPAQFAGPVDFVGSSAYNAARNIVAIGGSTEVSVRDCMTGKELKNITLSDSRRLSSLTMTGDGRTLVVGLEEGLIDLWDI